MKKIKSIFLLALTASLFFYSCSNEETDLTNQEAVNSEEQETELSAAELPEEYKFKVFEELNLGNDNKIIFKKNELGDILTNIIVSPEMMPDNKDMSPVSIYEYFSNKPAPEELVATYEKSLERLSKEDSDIESNNTNNSFSGSSSSDQKNMDTISMSNSYFLNNYCYNDPIGGIKAFFYDTYLRSYFSRRSDVKTSAYYSRVYCKSGNVYHKVQRRVAWVWYDLDSPEAVPAGKMSYLYYSHTSRKYSRSKVTNVNSGDVFHFSSNTAYY